MNNLVWEETSKIIVSTIKRANKNAKTILLWQNNDGSKKTIALSYVQDVNILDSKVTFSLMNLESRYQFDLQKVLYGRLDERSLIFKSPIVSMSKHLITAHIPDKVRLLELRSFERSIFGRESSIYSDIDRVVDDLLGKKEYRLRLFDVSRSGASFIVKTGDRKVFKPSELLNIKSFGEMDMGAGLEAEVVYVKDVPYDEGAIKYGVCKLGVKFDHSIPERMYKTLLERVNR